MTTLARLVDGLSQYLNVRGVYLGRRSARLHARLYRLSNGRLPQPGGEPLPEDLWHGDEATVRARVRTVDDSSPAAGSEWSTCCSPRFSIEELRRCRDELALTGIRAPLDMTGFPGARDFVDQALLDALADGDGLVRLEPRDGSGVPLLDEGRLDAVLFCAKGHHLRRRDRFDSRRVILAGTAGAVPYLARPIDTLHYLARGKAGARRYVWATYVTKRPAGYRWLRATRRA